MNPHAPGCRWLDVLSSLLAIALSACGTIVDVPVTEVPSDDVDGTTVAVDGSAASAGSDVTDDDPVTPAICDASSCIVPRAPASVNLRGTLTEFDRAPVVRVTSGDATASFRLLWDDSYLYVAAQVSDADVRDNGAGEDGAVYDSDSVEILLDPLHTRSTTPDTSDRHLVVSAANAKYDATGAAGDGGTAAWDMPGLEWQALLTLPSTLNDAIADQGYQIALRIPWAALNVVAAEGLSLGTDLALNNLDAAGRTTRDWAGLTSYARPSSWRELVLAGD